MPEEKISAIIPVTKGVLSDENKLFMSTKNGIVKKPTLWISPILTRMV